MLAPLSSATIRPDRDTVSEADNYVEAYNDAATGDHSFAARHKAKAHNDSCFTWGNSLIGDVGFRALNQFIARASGGVWFYSNTTLTEGAGLTAGGDFWSVASDMAVKENVTPVNEKSVLSRLVAMPMAEWNYKTQDALIRHTGLMAQDVNAADGLAEDERHLSTVDAGGVALVAVQRLPAMITEKEVSISSLEEKNGEVEGRLEALEELVKKLTDRQGEQE